MHNHTVKYHSIKHQLSSVLMILMLLWLTVSMPFVYAAQSSKPVIAKQIYENMSDEECSNPYANTTEEKTPSGVNTLSEYLHELDGMHWLDGLTLEHGKCHPADEYIACHPEFIAPPPKV